MTIYKMTRITFGATCSPCSEQCVKDENANKYSNIYPRAVESVIHNHNVDNLSHCYNIECEAFVVAKQIYCIH